MIDINTFYDDFKQSILLDTESRGLLRHDAFFENICEELLSIGELGINYTLSQYTKRGLEIGGYDYDAERKLLTLLITNYYQNETMQVLPKQVIETKFKRLKKFFVESIERPLFQEMEETSEAYGASYEIHNLYNGNKIRRIRCVLLTDGKATRNLESLPGDELLGIPVDYLVIDIEYLYKIFLSDNFDSGFEIDMNVPYLKVDTKNDHYESYLAVLDGNTLADIYDTYGQRLLEQNVRTFLQFRGKVNKGLRNTIEYSPTLFFAYNNGITATATDVITDDNGNICKVKNFQIVNGGQTTSSIYAAKKNHKMDISQIFVQMKLSKIKNVNNKDEIVSRISEYANTQNKVNKSDFFSNSAFHKEFKSFSKRTMLSPKDGAQTRTRWFYERVRGEYLNQQAYLTKSEKKKFQLENPKSQLVDKTFLSKSENSWSRKPHIVSKGAQYSFEYFAESVTSILEKNQLAITERYYKDAISKVIMFRKIEKTVSKASWYDGGFRAQTVTYTMAYFSDYVAKQKLFFDFDCIWDLQDIPQPICIVLSKIAEQIYALITDPPEGYANISQYCKKEICWNRIKNVSIDINLSSEYFIDTENMAHIKKEDKKSKKMDNGIDRQIFVYQQDLNIWLKISEYYHRKENIRDLSSMQRDILKKMSQGRISPSEKQSSILYDIYVKAKEIGLSI